MITSYENILDESENKLWNQVRFHNLNVLYEELNQFIDGGFEDKPEGKSDYDMFMKTNMEKYECLTYMPKNAVKNGGCTVVPCQVTQGSLSPITIDASLSGTVDNYQYITSDVSLGDFVIDENTKIQNLSKAVVDNNDGFEYGDQISLICAETAPDNSNIFHCQCFADKVTLDMNNMDYLRSRDGNPQYLSFFTNYNNKLALRINTLLSSDKQFSPVWVHSRLDETEKLIVSTQSMPDDNIYTSAEDRTTALISYGYDDSVIPFIKPGDSVFDGGKVIEIKTLDTVDLTEYVSEAVTSWTSSDTAVATVSNGVVSSLDYTYTGSTECPFKYTDITAVTTSNDTYIFRIKVIPRNVVLTDGQPYLNKYDFIAENVSYTRSFSKAGTWMALYLPFAFDVEEYKSDFDIAEIYVMCPTSDTNGDGVLDSSDDKKLILSTLHTGSTQPNAPYMIRPKATKSYTIVSENTTLAFAEINEVEFATSRTQYSVKGIYAADFYAVPGDNNFYITASGGLGYASTKNVNIKPNRWVLHEESKDYCGSSTSS